jgi:hypothetical protein
MTPTGDLARHRSQVKWVERSVVSTGHDAFSFPGRRWQRRGTTAGSADTPSIATAGGRCRPVYLSNLNELPRR